MDQDDEDWSWRRQEELDQQEQQTEVLRDVPGFPGYRATESGHVWSDISGRYLSPLKTSNGYLHVVLMANRQKRRIAVHRVVAMAFHGSAAKGMVVNHKNGIRNDNRPANLEWVTQSENVKDGYVRGSRVIDQAHRERAAMLGRARKKTTPDQEAKIRQMFHGKRGDISRLSKSTGLSRDVISRIVEAK